MTRLLALLLVLGPGVAQAHDIDAIGSAGTWTYDPWIVVPLYASALLYLLGSRRLWKHAGLGRGVRVWQAACFWCGWTLLALALISPLHWLGERLFLAHMIEHEVLMVLAAPLLTVARPIGAWLWALPRSVRRPIAKAMHQPAVRGVWSVLRHPLVATTVHGVALWVWHMPLLYDQVLTNITMHRLQHVSFFASALLFWWSLFYGVRRHDYGVAVACLFITSLHSAVLGIFLTLARQPWYPQQGAFAEMCGLTPLEDQQLAGLIMWVPPGMIYLALALYFAGRWIAQAGTAPSLGGAHALAAR